MSTDAGSKVEEEGGSSTESIVSSPSTLKWRHAPKSVTTVDGALRVVPFDGTDYWRDTYYVPAMRADNGAFFHTTLEGDCMIEVEFTLHPQKQFDQAGIMLRLGEKQWLKTGIEHVDGESRLSCVVTNTFSDWSTQNWASKSLRLRVHRINVHDFAVEYMPQGDGAKWTMIRIARLHPQQPGEGGAAAATTTSVPLELGAYVAAPTRKETPSPFFVDFTRIAISTGSRAFHHDTE